MSGDEIGEAMGDFDIYAFDSIIGGDIITDNPRHQLYLKWFKTVYGFTAFCSCGERIGKNSISGNNWAGWDYGLLAIKRRFNKHVWDHNG